LPPDSQRGRGIRQGWRVPLSTGELAMEDIQGLKLLRAVDPFRSW